MICHGLLRWLNGVAGNALSADRLWSEARVQLLSSRTADQLLVAASPHDDIADTHWYRADVDHFLVKEAQSLGVEYRDCTRIETLDLGDEGATIVGHAGEEPFHLHARLLIDATGPRGFLHRSFAAGRISVARPAATESLYSHFTGVARTEAPESVPPILSTMQPYTMCLKADGYGCFDSTMELPARESRLPRRWPRNWRSAKANLRGSGCWIGCRCCKSQFGTAVACQPFRYMPQVSFRSRTIAGDDGQCCLRRRGSLTRCSQPAFLLR